MDPTKCFNAMLAALKSGEFDAAQEHHEDLCEWISNRGFEPSWTPAQRAAFLSGAYESKIATQLMALEAAL
jgi:hypothetical protein